MAHEPSQQPVGDRGAGALVLIPTYNELGNLPLILDRLISALPDIDVLVIDDGSPDGTGQLADTLAAQRHESPGDGKIHVMHRQAKNGLGAAYIAGFRWALDREYRVVVEMDADGSHAPEQLHRLLDRINEGADLVIGSRYVPGGSTVNWPLSRQIISRGGNLYSRIALGTWHVRDITAGFRAYRRAVLETLDLGGIEAHGYCFQIDLAWRTHLAGFTIAEVPITFTEREIGDSKMSGSIFKEAALKVPRWGLEHRLRRLRGTR